MKDIPLMILNRKSGSKDHDRIREKAIQRHYQLVETEYSGHGTELAERAAAEGRQLIIAAGGDGTVSEVATGIIRAEKNATLGIIPLGTGNDLCRSLAIDDIETALQLLQNGRRIDMDVGIISLPGNDRYFFNVSSCGFGGEVDRNLENTDKSRWGPLSYLKSGIAALSELEPFRVDIFLENETLGADVLNVVVGNGKYAASGIPVASQARLNDGKLDAVLYMGHGPTDQIFNSRLILQGEQDEADEILTLRSEKFLMKFSRPISINYDGELHDEEVSEISYTIHSQRLKVIVGQNFT